MDAGVRSYHPWVPSLRMRAPKARSPGSIAIMVATLSWGSRIHRDHGVNPWLLSPGLDASVGDLRADRSGGPPVQGSDPIVSRGWAGSSGCRACSFGCWPPSLTRRDPIVIKPGVHRFRAGNPPYRTPGSHASTRGRVHAAGQASTRRPSAFGAWRLDCHRLITDPRAKATSRAEATDRERRSASSGADGMSRA